MRWMYFLYFTVSSIWLACGNDNRTDGTEPLPDNPTEVVRLYQNIWIKTTSKLRKGFVQRQNECG
ncbi:MAG: hypothetical protein HC892_23060 [Saprospiraceae bacterium]|nr:hypothetical protein [Saprospiraceae bacterium]